MSNYNNLILYHGSPYKFTTFDFSRSNKLADFGAGFYLTRDIKMASKMAHRVAKRKKLKTAFLYSYSISKDSIKYLSIKKFNSADRDWARFVINNRTYEHFKHNYDIVIRPTADARIIDIIKEYNDKIYGPIGEDYTLDNFIEATKAYVFSTQVCLHTQRAVDCAKLIDIKHI